MMKEKNNTLKKIKKSLHTFRMNIPIIAKKLLPVWIILGFVAILTTTLALLEKKYEGSFTYALFTELDKALLLSGALTVVIRFITDGILSIIKKESALKEVGITEITGGISTQEHINKTFGLKGEDVPKCLKFFFITGIKYLNRFKYEIIDAIRKNNCEIRILLADEKAEGFLRRMQEYKRETETMSFGYHDEIEETKEFIRKTILDNLTDEEKKRIVIRQYIDEYRLSLRVACCFSGKIMAWSDMLPPNGTAADFDASSMFVSVYDPSKRDKKSINYAIAFDKYFDAVWEKYNDINL